MEGNDYLTAVFTLGLIAGSCITLLIITGKDEGGD